MTAPLRPMNLGEILDRTFQIYRSRFLVFVGIRLASPLITLIILVLGEVGATTTLSAPTKAMFSHAASWMPRDWPASFIHYLGWPLIAFLTSHELLAPRATLRSGIDRCKERWRGWLSISAFLWAVCSLLPYAFQRLVRAADIGPWIALHWGNGLLFSVVSLLLSLLEWGVECLFVLGVALSAPAWAAEQLGTVPSVRRGWTLAKGSWVRVLTAELVRDALGWILLGSLTLIFVAVLSFALGGHEVGVTIYQLRYKFILIAAPAVSTLVGAILPIALTVIYYDQRIRKEGFDIERMMDAAGLNATATLPAADEPVVVAGPEEGQA